MMMKIFAVALLALALTACESSSDNTNSANENKPAATTPAAATPATAASPVSSPAATAVTQLKAGDKVKVTLNGSSSEATIVSVDDKAGKATVKIQGQKEDKTVALSAVTKQ